jgi:hypothetical protein
MPVAIPLIVGEIINNVLGIFKSRTDGNNLNNSYQLGSQQGQENYYYSTNNANCISLNHKINTEIESCASHGVSGIEGYLFTSIDKERAKCRLNIENNYRAEINRCTKDIEKNQVKSELEKQKTKNMQIVGGITAIAIVLIIIIILKS